MGKAFEIKLILNEAVLRQFVSSNSDNQKWEFVYHGTASKNNNGIIANGLIVGGTRGVRVHNGAVYGRGIYCSLNSQTARAYERGSMFVCIARDNGNGIRKNGAIWVVQKERDILPLYLVSIGQSSNGQKLKPKWPYFPVSAALQSIIQKNVEIGTNDDGMSQRILKFVPTFTLLNDRRGKERKLRRKWSAYHKINRFLA